MVVDRARLRPWVLPILASAYFVVAKLGLGLAYVHSSASPVWPATGVAIAAMLVWGLRVWPAIAAGGFLAHLTTAGSVPASLGVAAGNTLEALVAAWLVRRFAGGRDAFDRAEDIFKFGAITGLLAATASATVGVASLVLAGHADWERMDDVWLTWWLGDTAGALVVGPLLLLWSRPPWTPRREDRRAVALLFTGLLLVGSTVFGGVLAPVLRHAPLSFLFIPLMVWAAFRFSPRETATAIAVLSGMAIWGTLHHHGPFVHGDANQSLLLLQAFTATLAMTMLPLAAVARAHARAEAALARSAAIVDSSDDAIIGKTLDGIITTWNRGAERFYGYSADEAIGRSVQMLIPHELDQELPGILARLARGEVVESYETVRLHREGRRVDVSVTVSPTHDARGKVIGASSIARDITHKREAEAARRERDLLRCVAALAAAAAHEINNPLLVIVGQAELLANEVDGPRRRRVDEILEAAWRVRENVERMRHVNRIVLLDGTENLPQMLDFVRSSPPAEG